MPQGNQAVDTTAGESYEKHIVPGMFVVWAEYAVKWAAPQAGAHVLDVACGTGIGARVAARAVGRSGKIEIDLHKPTIARVMPGFLDLALGAASRLRTLLKTEQSSPTSN